MVSQRGFTPVAFVGFGCVLLVIGVMAYFFKTQGVKDPNVVQAPNPTQIKKSPNAQPSNSPSAKTYSSSMFSLSIPANWQSYDEVQTPVFTSVTLKPSGTPTGLSVPYFTITAENYNEVSLKEQQKAHIGRKLTQSSTVVNGKKATVFSGPFANQLKSARTDLPTIWIATIVSNSTLYTLEYSYLPKTQNSGQAEIEGILPTIIFTK